jgi:hypothetical protein
MEARFWHIMLATAVLGGGVFACLWRSVWPQGAGETVGLFLLGVLVSLVGGWMGTSVWKSMRQFTRSGRLLRNIVVCCASAALSVIPAGITGGFAGSVVFFSGALPFTSSGSMLPLGALIMGSYCALLSAGVGLLLGSGLLQPLYQERNDAAERAES